MLVPELLIDNCEQCGAHVTEFLYHIDTGQFLCIQCATGVTS